VDEIGWVQIGVGPCDGDRSRLYADLAALASDLLTDPAVKNFFFMNKPPGLRIRFEVSADRREPLEDLLCERAAGWGNVTFGVYEPEAHLFGGASSMRYVHRLFTLDAQAWLAFHGTAGPVPGWLFSLALLRWLFDGLAIVGWEDLDVWERIRSQGFRRLPPELNGERLAAVAPHIRTLWTDGDRLRGALTAGAADLLDQWGPRLRDAGSAWHSGYFGERGATIGPREGAAFATIFHWNRGRLPSGTQAVVTAALADRSARP
jgi:thiopeptide-type bacteriocin biosynthesis protein